MNKVKREIASEREKFYEEKKKLLTEQLAPSSARQLELISERGVSCIVKTLHLKDFGFILNKQQFHDHIALRYNYKISDFSGTCGCNKVSSITLDLVPADVLATWVGAPTLRKLNQPFTFMFKRRILDSETQLPM